MTAHVSLTSTISRSDLYQPARAVPINVSLPTLSDTPREDTAVTCLTGSFLNFPTGYTYQWYLDGVALTGATANSYTPTVLQVGGSLTCRVVASNPFGSSAIVETAAGIVTFATIPLRTFKVSATDPTATYTSITGINAATFLPGDAILFKGGETFSGALVVPSSGDSSHRITFGSYGGGRATISSGTSKGCYALNKAYVDVRDLILVGAGGATNATHGVHFENNQASNTTLAGPRLINLDVSGYGWNGVYVDGSNGTSHFDGAQIRYVTAHDNTGGTTSSSAGIRIRSTGAYAVQSQAHTNTLLEYCTAYSNTGKAGSSNHTGSGIIVGDATDTTVRNCTAYSNGSLHTYSGGGPFGIWTYNSTRTVIQDCTSYSNTAGSSTKDGGGFDLDGGSKDCVIERCLSYNNNGPGFLAYAYTGDSLQAHTGNTIRNCISVLDCVTSTDMAPVHVQNDDTPGQSVNIYQNTVYYSHGYGCVYFLRTSGAGLITAKVGNNILYNTHATGFSVYEDVDAGVSTAAGITLRGNCYAMKGRLAYFNADVYRSIDGFLAAETTQEKVSSTVVATSAEPKFASPGTLTAAAYQLQTGSPLADIGINLSTVLSITAPTTDYFGNTRPASGVSIGAHETTAQSTSSEAEINATYTVSSTEPAYGDPVASPTIMRNGTFVDASSWGSLVEGSSGTPQWIKADLGSVKTVTKIQTAPRSTSVALRAAKVYVSTDNSVWTYVGRVYGTAASTLADFPIGSRQARYVKLEKDYDSVNTTHESRFLVLSEFRIFGY